MTSRPYHRQVASWHGVGTNLKQLLRDISGKAKLRLNLLPEMGPARHLLVEQRWTTRSRLEKVMLKLAGQRCPLTLARHFEPRSLGIEFRSRTPGWGGEKPLAVVTINTRKGGKLKKYSE